MDRKVPKYNQKSSQDFRNRKRMPSCFWPRLGKCFTFQPPFTRKLGPKNPLFDLKEQKEFFQCITHSV